MKLLTEVVEFRGDTYTVRELNAAEFATWGAAMREDPNSKLIEAARLGTIEPKLGDVAALPAALVLKLAGAVLRLSEATDDPKAPTSSETSTA